MNAEGQIINLTKLAFEKDSPNKGKILERAYLLSLNSATSSQLRTVAAINLASSYSKQNLDFRAICVLTETLSLLKPENLWERSVILLNLAKLKSSMNYPKDSLADLLQSLSLLNEVKSKDLNFFIVLTVLHFNLSVEFSKVQKFAKSEKHLALAKSLATENQQHKFLQFLETSHKKTEPLANRLKVAPSPYKSPRNLPMSTRSKSSMKDGKTIYKKFDRISQSFDLVTMKNKERLKKIKNFQPPLEALLEEDECFSTSYPKFSLENCKSCKGSETNSVLRSTFGKDPDPEPVEKDSGVQDLGVFTRTGKKLKKVSRNDFSSQSSEEKREVESFEYRKKKKDRKIVERTTGRIRHEKDFKVYKSSESHLL